jgi:hypothetical protein
MAYRVQASRPAQQDTWQRTHATPLMGLGGRRSPTNIAGLAQPFPYSHDWRERAGLGIHPGPSATHARMYMNQQGL